MTVAQFIEELKKLEQERGIWVAYDFPYAMFEPMPDARADKYHVNIYGDELGVKEGDYVINAG